MQQTNSLLEAIQQESDVNRKTEHLAVVLETQCAAILNVLLSVITAAERTPGFNRDELRKDLEELKILQMSNGIDRHMYGQTIDVCISRLTPQS